MGQNPWRFKSGCKVYAKVKTLRGPPGPFFKGGEMFKRFYSKNEDGELFAPTSHTVVEGPVLEIGGEEAVAARTLFLEATLEGTSLPTQGPLIQVEGAPITHLYKARAALPKEGEILGKCMAGYKLVYTGKSFAAGEAHCPLIGDMLLPKGGFLESLIGPLKFMAIIKMLSISYAR